jgi:hypothetical protein
LGRLMLLYRLRCCFSIGSRAKLCTCAMNSPRWRRYACVCRGGARGGGAPRQRPPAGTHAHARRGACGPALARDSTAASPGRATPHLLRCRGRGVVVRGRCRCDELGAAIAKGFLKQGRVGAVHALQGRGTGRQDKAGHGAKAAHTCGAWRLCGGGLRVREPRWRSRRRRHTNTRTRTRTCSFSPNLSLSAASTCSSRPPCTAGHSALTSASSAYICARGQGEGGGIWGGGVTRTGGTTQAPAASAALQPQPASCQPAARSAHPQPTSSKPLCLCVCARVCVCTCATHLLVLLQDLVVGRVARMQLLHSVNVRQDGVQAPARARACVCVCVCVCVCFGGRGRDKTGRR